MPWGLSCVWMKTSPLIDVCYNLARMLIISSLPSTCERQSTRQIIVVCADSVELDLSQDSSDPLRHFCKFTSSDGQSTDESSGAGFLGNETVLGPNRNHNLALRGERCEIISNSSLLQQKEHLCRGNKVLSLSAWVEQNT